MVNKGASDSQLAFFRLVSVVHVLTAPWWLRHAYQRGYAWLDAEDVCGVTTTLQTEPRDGVCGR